MNREEIERRLRVLIRQAWDNEIDWDTVESWLQNFDGRVFDKAKEELLALFSLTRFMYFSKRMMREMLRSLYRDQFRAPLIQRIRRNYGDTRNEAILTNLYRQELAATRFIGVGNPSESGAHLLYYFRQVNRLGKDLFIDIADAMEPSIEHDRTGKASIKYVPKSVGVSRLVFFDDIVGSGDQASGYLSERISNFRRDCPGIDLRYLCLFGTKAGMSRLNSTKLFNGNAACMFEMDETYKAFHNQSRMLANPPSGFSGADFEQVARIYGRQLQPENELGYSNGQLMIGFSHNTPDNALPIFWDEGVNTPWRPVFIRFDKQYGGNAS